ncbi:MAG TPA: SIMPL domain-containing protein [Mobilitalea sp.]|nr:SIMPL domain-containing protein [Mobilitalea sp.]
MNENKQRIIGNIIVASILSVAIIFSCFLGVYGLAEFKSKRNEIDIKGWTKQQIVSDVIVWTGRYEVEASNLKDGYSILEGDREKVRKYFVGKGFAEDELIFSSISVFENHVYTDLGGYTEEIGSYDLAQTITISSDQIENVTEVSRNATELINEGVQFQSYAPEYHYTKLEDLKVSMLAEATKDATKRGELIAKNAGSKLGDLSYAKLSKITVTPLYSVPDSYYNEYGGYVDNDTVSLEKEVTVSVNCTFEIDN